MCTAYKIYAEVIRNRMEKEVEEKGMTPESQAGFRRGRSTIDNIFVLNYLMQREKRQGRKDGKICMMFADMKAAFDNVERSTLWRELRRKEIKRDLIKKIEKIYERTETVIRTNQGYTDSFRTRKGVRQSCVLSPFLFNLYMVEIEERLESRGIGGVGIGKIRVWNLAYADDIVLVANNKDALLDMIDTFKKFLKDMKLELCTEKSKLLVFNRKRKERKEKWLWGEKKLRRYKSLNILAL